jgi:HK97 family phage major capsid protein
MSLTKARELREKRAKLVADARALYDKSGRTAEDNQRFDQMMAEADQIKVEIDREERLDAAETENQRTGAPPNGNPGTPGASSDAEKQKRYREVWKRTMKFDGPREYGFRGISEEDRAFMREFRDMGTGGGNALQGSGGGYFVPVGFVDEIETALKYYGPMLDVATIMETASGQPLPYPTQNDTGTVGAIIGEGTQVTTESDLTVGNLVLGAYKYTTNLVKVSIELLQDSAFDLESYLKDQFAIRIGRVLNNHFTVGTGSSQPKGIIPAATAGPTAVGASGNDGGAETGGTSIGSDDLIELEHSVDILYRRDARYMMHDSTLKSIKKLKDKYGRPLWLPGLAANDPDTINGYPYSVNNDMATIAVNAKTVTFGPHKKYLIRRVKELQVLRLVERFADYGQVAFLGFARYDGNLLDAGTHPVKYLVQAAS